MVMPSGSGQSTYIKIYHMIANDIYEGTYKPGDVLPTQHELAKKYNVSRATISEAVKELIRRKLVKTQKGKGTFAISQPIAIGNFKRFDGFSAFQNQHQDRNLTNKVLSIDTIPVPESVAVKLRVGSGAMVDRIIRVRYLDNLPMSHETSYLLRSYLKDIDLRKEGLERNSLYHVLRTKAGVEFNYSEDELKAVFAAKGIAELLEIDVNEPSLHIGRVSGLDSEHLVEYVDIIERSDITYTKFQSKRVSEIDRPVEQSCVEWEEPEICSKLFDALQGSMMARSSYGKQGLQPEGAEETRFMRMVIDDEGALSRSLNDFEESIRWQRIPLENYLLSLSPAVFLNQSADKSFPAGLLHRLIRRCGSAGEYEAVMAYLLSLRAASSQLPELSEVLSAATGAYPPVERSWGMPGVSVKKRIALALHLGENRTWREFAEEYQALFGWGKDLETQVPLMLGLLSCLGPDYAGCLHSCSQIFRAPAMGALFGLLVGAFNSRVTFSREETLGFEQERSRFRLLAKDFCRSASADLRQKNKK